MGVANLDPSAATRTTCPYCGVGCGVLATPMADGSVGIAGDPDHPANYGRLCSKGSALGETLGLDGRLLHPQIGGRRAGWDEALDLVASTFAKTIAEHGRDSVAFYVSGQLLTEDYYAANKLMKGFIGSANIDTNSRLCMASSVAGHRRAFGADTVPGTYEDLELADLVVLVGSNLAWCHPVLYQRLAAAKATRPEMRVVVVDPRRTATAEGCDLFLSIRPDGDTALFLGLLAYLERAGKIDRAWVDAHVAGLDAAMAEAEALDPATLAELTGLDATDTSEFFSLFAETERVVTVFSQGVNQSRAGTDKVNAIINCHLATGRIGRPGMGPFSVTGQPNAMGGREVGGLANMLAAHMEIENPAHRALVQDFWQSPAIAAQPGLKAVDLFRAVGDGRIKALWIMATNPVDSLPEADAVAEALAACPFVVVSDVVADTDTLRHAHVKLPAAAWGEKDGTVTNSERRISRQRAFVPPPGDARPDWWIVGQVARRMGFVDGFAWDGPAAIFAEYAALSGSGNAGVRDFDISAFAAIGASAYAELDPFQWPAPAGVPSQGGRFFADGRFFTADRKARAIAVSPPTPRSPSPAFPMILNTGRVRDHWHTMTRTGKSPRLSAHLGEPFVEIHPADAAQLRIDHATVARVVSAQGSVLVRALLTPRVRRGEVFVPMHWNDQFAARARVDAVVAALTDPFSGQPASKNVPVRVEPFAAAVHGFAVAAEKPRPPADGYWAVGRATAGWRMELALTARPDDPAAFARRLLAVEEGAEMLAYVDSKQDRYRFAFFVGERLVGALFLSPEPVAVSRLTVAAQLEAVHTDQRARYRVVAGRAGADRPDPGAIVCSCFSVGINDIAAAAMQGCVSVEEIGQVTRAGTNCGSCRAEIRGIIDAHRAVAAE